MLSPEAAWARLEPHLSPLGVVEMERARSLARVLARPMAATVDVPFADLSAMDGYAYSGDLPAGTRLPVDGRVAAGDRPGRGITSGDSVRIMTGAPVPDGGDRVIPVEATDGGRDEVVLSAPVDAGANIRRRGEVHRRGDEILPAGTALHPATLALAAAHGHATLPVHRPPAVGLVVTGDEVVPSDREPQPGQLRDTHGPFLSAACARLGLDVVPLGIAPDRKSDLAALVRRGSELDVLLLTGGVSMGELDFVEEILEEQGCEILFRKVAVQPGKPLVAAVHEGGLVFGLPGNPASVMVTFRLFVQPALRRLQGHEDAFWHGALDARLAAPLPGAKSRDRFLPAGMTVTDGRLEASPLPGRGSHDLTGHAHSRGLVRIPAGSEPKKAGDPCQVLLDLPFD